MAYVPGYGVNQKRIDTKKYGRFYTNTANYYATSQSGYQAALAQQQANQRQDALRATAKTEQDRLSADYQSAYTEAKTANEQRYGEIVKGYQSRYSTAVTDLEGLGEAEKAEIGRVYAMANAQNAQSLISSGLHSTTIAPSVRTQGARAESDTLALANERIRRERLGYTTGMSKELLDFMERREDTYPDTSLYVNLMNQLGQYGS